MSEEVKVTDVTENTLSTFEKLIELLKKYGPLRMVGAVVFFVFFSWMTYMAINPGIVFEKYEKYVTEVHNASVDYRLESSPIIRTYLNQLALNTGAERAYILEFHNGKSNPSGLQWQYGDLTFINDGTDDISDEIQNVSLSRYNFANIIHDKGYWAGYLEELSDLDERFYNRLRVNDGKYFVFQVIYGSNMREIGILGVTFMEGNEIPERTKVLMEVHKYASVISPLLDESNARKK